MKKTKLLTIILLIVALVGALALVNKNQEMRKGATFANTTLSVLPSEKITGNVGDTITAKIWFYTENDGAKVDGVQAQVCYGDELSLGESDVAANTSAGFEESPIVSISQSDESTGQNCAIVVATSKKEAGDLLSTAEAVTLNFSAVKEGSGTITINKDKSAVTGENTASTTDKSLAITNVAGTSYEIGGGATGDEPILNYKISYANVNSNAACVVKWPMQVIVLGGGESKVYTNVIPSSVVASGDKLVASGSLALTGFNHLDKVAAFFKGPKHLQMKYAVQNQNKAYDKAGGELVLTKDKDTSVVYDFTAYPMIPGDVTGPTEGIQDGWVDGIDFAYVKAKSLTHETVDDGAYLLSDLDGNCQTNSNDVNVLKISLQTKQGQLY